MNRERKEGGREGEGQHEENRHPCQAIQISSNLSALEEADDE